MKLIYLHGQKEDPNVTHITFPTGEKHIRILGLKPSDDVVLVYNDSSGDIMKLALAVNICRRARVQSLELVMPFVPYARQDRVAVPGDPLSIKVFADFLNSMRFDRVLMTDPHSDITPALIDNSDVIPQHEIAAKAVLETHQKVGCPLALVAPDLGAAKKTKALQQYIKQIANALFPIIQCDKTRDVTTGQITGFQVLEGQPIFHHCFMVDDICDGGGTFLGLAATINRYPNVQGQSLYVTHGIFSKGVEALGAVFANIYASDSFPSVDGVQTIQLGDKNE